MLLLWLVLRFVTLALSASLSLISQGHDDANYKSPSRLADRSANTATTNVLSLSRRSIGSDHPCARRVRSKRRSRYTDTPLSTPSDYAGQIYSAEITFGSETFTAVVDTGSSDTWLVRAGFDCISPSNGSILPEASCGFGPPYSISSTFESIPDENFNITYGGGAFANGDVGIEKVTLAGITVEQEVAAVDVAAFTLDGGSSGFIGLAYPNLTAVFAGTDPENDNLDNDRIYNPIFTTMYKQRLIPPVFSVALNRPGTAGPAGYLALGGLPPVPFQPNFASTPILPTTTNVLGGPPYSTPQFQSYTIELDGVTYGASQDDPRHEASNFSSYNVTVDTGFSLTFLDPTTAADVAALFSPPATPDPVSGTYYVACNATGPSVGIKIGGQVFHIDPVDLVVQNGDENGDGKCVSGIQTFGDASGVLGDPFLKNVVAVHDVGASEMRFAAREYY